MFKQLLFCLGFLLVSSHSLAEELHIGCAANFSPTAAEIARLFEKITAHKVTFVVDASGKLAALAKETQSLDILLLAESKIAKKLEAEGFTVKSSRFTYALGKLVLWSKKPNLVDNKGEILYKNNFEHLMLPDYNEASYGIAAKETLDNMGLWEKLKDKIVTANNVAEARNQIAQGKADLGFTALALLNPNKKIEGSVWIVPQRFYLPIEQQAVLLKPAEDKPSAQTFMAFLKTPQVRNIIEKYSYSVAIH